MRSYLNLRDKSLRKKQFTTFIAISFLATLPACVTQDFENGETPVVKNQANRDDMAATRISLGLGYLKMGNMPQAKQNLEKAKLFAPEMVQVYTAFAHYYETVSEPELTVNSYEKALSLKSDDADTLNNYGVYLCRQGQAEAAEKQFLKAIAVPSYILVAKSYENLSSCFLQKDNFVKAEAYLKKAIAHSPSSASTLFQMVRLQYAMADYKQAKFFEQRFEKVTRRFTPQSLALAFKVYTKLSQQRTAKNYGTMLVKMYPQSWEAQQYLLNELEQIEPDNLAKRYQLTQVSTKTRQSKKRIVKLSPKKNAPKNNAHIASVPKVTTPVVKTAPKLDNPAKKSVLVAEQTAHKTLSPKIASLSAASPDGINAALISTVVEPETSAVISTNIEQVNNKAENKPSIKPDKLTLQDNKPVAMSEPLAKQATAVKTEEVAVSKDKVAMADTKVFYVAEKPKPIVEEAAQETNEIKVVGKVELKPAKKFPKFHVVEAGDTLYNISVKYNIKINALRKWNKMSKNKRLYIKDIVFLENPKLVNK